MPTPWRLEWLTFSVPSSTSHYYCTRAVTKPVFGVVIFLNFFLWNCAVLHNDVTLSSESPRKRVWRVKFAAGLGAKPFAADTTLQYYNAVWAARNECVETYCVSTIRRRKRVNNEPTVFIAIRARFSPLGEACVGVPKTVSPRVYYYRSYAPSTSVRSNRPRARNSTASKYSWKFVESLFFHSKFNVFHIMFSAHLLFGELFLPRFLRYYKKKKN